MSQSDITIIFLTANRLPAKWAEYQRSVLREAADGAPIIVISREPSTWGDVNLLDQELCRMFNIYRQLLRGAQIATTPYIAMAEDDTLYPREHYHSFRPADDEFTYNHNRLGLFSWGVPTYFWRDRISNSTLIAPRELTIEALTERFTKYPNGVKDKVNGELGRRIVEKNLKLTPRKMVWFESQPEPVVRLDHPLGIDTVAQKMKKRMGEPRGTDIPYWGKAEDIVKKFHDV